MDFITSIILYALITSYFFGQLLRIHLANFSFPLIDLLIVLLALFNLVNHVKNRDLKINNRPFFLFLLFAVFTFLINHIIYQFPLLTPLLYLFRLIAILSLIIFPINHELITPRLCKYFFLILFANVIFGLIQYIFWPDSTLFRFDNWDPHLYRLISTFFDPTFTGIIYLIFLIFVLFNYLKNKLLLPFVILIYIATALTYSRSTLLSLLLTSLFISFKTKKIKFFLVTIILITFTVFTLPKNPGEGSKLERTSTIKAKIENYREAIFLFKKSPLIGHGYNNLPYIRDITNPKSHANSGFDGSLMTILTTTGIIGFIFFTSGLYTFYQKSPLMIQSIILATVSHSFFANSLLYSWMLISIILLKYRK